MRYIIRLSIIAIILTSCFKSENIARNQSDTEIPTVNTVNNIKFDGVNSFYVAEILSNTEKEKIRGNLLLAAEKSPTNPLLHFYTSKSLNIYQYNIPLSGILAYSKMYFITNNTDEKVESLLLIIRDENRVISDQHLLYENYSWEGLVSLKSQINNNIITSSYLQVQSIDDEENLVRDTLQNYKKRYIINSEFKILNVNLQTSATTNSSKNDAKILDYFNYDFNNDKMIDKVELVQVQNKNKLVFYQNNGNDYKGIYESYVPHEHVFFEKEKSSQEKGLAISLVEKQQTVLEYIQYNKDSKNFNVTELCHTINETTPVGYKLKEKCKKVTKNISDLDFVEALEVLY